MSPVRKQGAHGGGATCPHCAMQRSYTGFILGIWIPAGPNQELHDCVLLVGVPRSRPWSSVSRVVEWFGATPVSGADLRAHRDKLLGCVSLVRRGSNVKGRITGVGIVRDFLKIVCACVSPSCADSDGHSRERGRLCKQPRRR